MPEPKRKLTVGVVSLVLTAASMLCGTVYLMGNESAKLEQHGRDIESLKARDTLIIGELQASLEKVSAKQDAMKEDMGKVKIDVGVLIERTKPKGTP